MIKKLLITGSLMVVIFSLSLIIFDHLSPEKIVWQGIFKDSQEMADWLLSFGPWAVLISITVMIIQTIATPVPLFLVAGANGFIFGIAWGIVITLVGALLGATVAFYLARVIARDYFSKRLSRYMPQVEEMSKKNGVKVVFLARLVPILPSSIVSYAAGLSKVSFSGFFLASVFGKLPEIIIYTALGHSLERAEGLLTRVTVVIILISLLCFSFQSKRFTSLFNKKLRQQKENKDR
ncbi:MAG: TVP38/TMEM64 family protein [Peptococcaceae bacterium]|nr:TVP38/TMEM64 family protein [Peptococcaceae bacterium]